MAAAVAAAVAVCYCTAQFKCASMYFVGGSFSHKHDESWSRWSTANVWARGKLVCNPWNLNRLTD